MNSKALLMATATLLALSAVSCGKDDSTENDVSISLSEQQTNTKETSASTTADEKETTTATSSTETTASTTDESVTTTDTDTTTTSAESTTDTAVAETVATEVTQAEETTPTESAEQPEDVPSTEAPPAETPAPEPEQPAEEPAPSEPAKFKIEDLLSDASGIIASLGTPTYSGGGASCLTNGHDDKIYQYDGLEIQCYIDGDIEYIFQINITGGDYQTDKGIKVGSSRAEVESAYGTGTESGNLIVYSSGDSEMDIQYEGDTVKSIFFYTPV